MLSNLAQIIAPPNQGVNGTLLNVEMQTCNTLSLVQVYMSRLVKSMAHLDRYDLPFSNSRRK